MYSIPSLDALVAELSKLPSIGRKSAMRMAYSLMRSDDERIIALENALAGLRAKLLTCEVCYSIAEQSPCPICSDPRRDHSAVCVVEEPMDLFSFEQSGAFRGVYHVLEGTLNPMRGVMGDQLRIKELLERIRRSHLLHQETKDADNPVAPIREIILATNPDVDGEATAHYLADEIGALSIEVAITRLGLGLPMGGDLEYADNLTISKALEGRRTI